MRGRALVILIVALAALGVWLGWPFSAEDSGPQISADPGDPNRSIAPTAPGIEVDRPIEARPFAADDQPPAIDEAPRPTRSALAPSSLIVALRDALDDPFAGVRVTLRPGERDQRTEVTGSDGEALFEGLAAGRYAYRIEAPGRPELRAAAGVRLVAGQTTRLELRLGEHDRSIAGRVRNRDGEPIAGLTVKARLYRPPAEATVLVPVSRAEQWAESAADGSFEIAGLADGEYEVRTLADDLYFSAEVIVRAGIDDAVLSVVERQEVRVFGQVTNAYGEVLAGASVVPFEAPSRRTRTDQEGRYELLVPAGNEVAHHRLAVRAEGYQPEHLDIGAAELEGLVDLRLDAVLEPLEASVTVTGRLIDAQGTSVAGEQVYLRARHMKTQYQAVSRADGSFAFPAVAASSGYDVRVLPRDPYKDYVRESVDLSVDPAWLEIVLEELAPGSLTGRMIDPAGRPVPWLGLRFRNEETRARWHQVTGDAEGRFELAEVPEGALVFQTASEPELRIGGVRADAGADTQVELVVDWGEAVLAGRVIDSGGAPLAGAVVDLSWRHERAGVQSRSARTTVTDGAGRFVFSRLGAGGTRSLEVRARNHGSFRQMLEPGQSWLEIRLGSLAELTRRATQK